MNQRRYKPTLERTQGLLLPERVEDYVGENNQIRALDAYVDSLDLASLGFKHTETGVAGQPPYNPWAISFTSTGIGGGYAAAASSETRRNLSDLAGKGAPSEHFGFPQGPRGACGKLTGILFCCAGSWVYLVGMR